MTTSKELKIMTPHPHDVLFGKGGFSKNHQGNVEFRKWIGQRNLGYREAQDNDVKAKISHEIFAQVKALEPPGRFLTKGEGTRYGKIYWLEVDEEKALSKTKQALRDGVPKGEVGKKRKAPETTVTRESTGNEILTHVTPADHKALSKTKQARRDGASKGEVGKKRKAPESAVNASTSVPDGDTRNLADSTSSKRTLRYKLRMERDMGTTAKVESQGLHLEEKCPSEEPTPIASESMGNDVFTPVTPADQKALSKTKQARRDGGKAAESAVNASTTVPDGDIRNRVDSTSSKRVLEMERVMETAAKVESQGLPMEEKCPGEESTTPITSESTGNDVFTPVTPTDTDIGIVQCAALKLGQWIEQKASNALKDHMVENDLISENSTQRTVPIANQDLHASYVTPELRTATSTDFHDPAETENVKAQTGASRIMMAPRKLAMTNSTFPRANSLALSEISMDETLDAPEEEFTNPFEDEEDMFDIIQGLLSQDFSSTQSYVDNYNVDDNDPLPYSYFESTTAIMSPYKLNVSYHSENDSNLDDGIHTLPFELGMQMDAPMTLNVIENEVAIESFDHDLSAWMKLGPDIGSL